MASIFYFIYSLILGLLFYGLVKKLKQSQAFNIIVTFVLMTIISILLFVIFPLISTFFCPPHLDKSDSSIHAGFGNKYSDKVLKLVKLDELVNGKIAYEVPDTMDIGKSYKATVIVTKSEKDSFLIRDFYQGNFQKEEIKVSSIVKVALFDPTPQEENFSIISLNTIEQFVGDSTNTVWKWNITPKRSGYNELVLRVTVKVLDRLGETYIDIRTFEKTIKVNVSIFASIKHFVGNNWVWFSNAIVIPLVIWFYSRFSNWKKKKADRKREQQKKRKEIEKMLNITT